MTRRLIVALFAVLLAAQVVRNAVVEAYADTAPDRAARVWVDHPSVVISNGMTAIAKAARKGQPADPGAIRQVIEASTKAPLRPEPFLVRGVQAQISGDLRLAKRAFAEAEWRDGRSLPARYFLAQHYLERGDARRGLLEISALARLVPDGVYGLAPYVARYASDRANWANMHELFRIDPRLGESTLNALARDPANTDAVLKLGRRPGPGAPSWIATLVQTLINAKQYDRARSVWGSYAGTSPRGALVFDPEFRRPDPLPPFNWSLTSSTVGLAERQRGGGLHVIYYGQEDGPLAGQLLMLKPGAYVLTTAATGPAVDGEALQWRLTCAPTHEQIASTPLGDATRGWQFNVPAGCPAQVLELVGVSSDVAQQTEVTVARITLSQEGPNG